MKRKKSKKNKNGFLKVMLALTAVAIVGTGGFVAYALGLLIEFTENEYYQNNIILDIGTETTSASNTPIAFTHTTYPTETASPQYLKETAPTYKLNEFLSQSRFAHMAVYYHNINTGFVFEHNANRVYFAASLTKAPFALYIYQKAEAGYTNLFDYHVFEEDYYATGSGIIRNNHGIGTPLTQAQLLGYNLYLSDNVALRMLRSIHGLDGFYAFVRGLGGDSTLIHNITYSRTTAREAGRFAMAMHNYIDSDGRYSRQFLDHLLNNHYPFILSNYPVASKTGWWHDFGGAWHDMSIVYAPSPYVLVVLSNNFGGDDTPLIQEIAWFIEGFNSHFYPQN